MRLRQWVREACCVLVTLVCATMAFAADDTAGQLFTEIFGARIKDAARTPGHEDDLRLAQEILTAARQTARQPALAAKMCHAAYDLGMKHADGHKTAIESMRLLIEVSPGARDQATEKLIDALNRRYLAADADGREKAATELADAILKEGNSKASADDWSAALSYYRRANVIATRARLETADDVRDRLRWANERYQTQKRIDNLRTVLLKDARNTAAAEALVMLYVVQLDDPAAARQYLVHLADDTLKAHVELAAKPVHDLDEKACAALADWYTKLAEDANGDAKRAMLDRALTCFKRYLVLHTEPDADHTRATLLSQQVEAELAKLDEADSSPPDRPKPVRRTRKVPPDAVIYKRHAYYLFEETLTWDEAKAKCEEMGGYLACIESADENAVVAKLIGNRLRVWIGGYKENGQWKWVDGSKFEYAKWNVPSVDPNAGDCTQTWVNGVWSGSGKKNANNKGFVCEWE